MLNEKIKRNKLLIHSRFNEKDREEKIKKLNEIKKTNDYIIVSTQTIEAGIDISSNLLISEIAPANSLIQRFGRFLRYENEYEGNAYVWYEVDENGELENKNGKYKVYDWYLTYRTIEELKKLGHSISSSEKDGIIIQSSEINFHIPEGYKKIIDSVYKYEEDFLINKEEVENLLSTFLNIKNLSEHSLEKYLKLEGSFIREEVLIPVITSDMIKVCLNSKQLDYIIKHIIPISIKLIKKLKIQGGITIGRENEKEEIEIINEIPNYQIENSQNLLKFMFKKSIIAFIIEAKYDNEIGLFLSEEYYE